METIGEILKTIAFVFVLLWMIASVLVGSTVLFETYIL